MSSQVTRIESSLGRTMELESILADSQSTVLTITLCSHQRRLLNNRMLILHFNRCIIRVAERILKWWFRKNSNLRPLPCQGSILPLKYGTIVEFIRVKMLILRKNLSTLSASWITKRQLSRLFCRPNETWNARRILQSHQNGFAIRCLTFRPRAHYSLVRPSGLEPEKV